METEDVRGDKRRTREVSTIAVLYMRHVAVFSEVRSYPLNQTILSDYTQCKISCATYFLWPSYENEIREVNVVFTEKRSYWL